MKKSERVAKAVARQARRQQYAHEEAAMRAFLRECRACLPASKTLARPPALCAESVSHF
ncbi:hypothetical protein GobsT_67340 [Gemmata obscuriglobus]|nr:hypothetical protein GobsT_67340 [Gemmata obscuriglobus]VTS11233.1 unnamed protein product [Gemmata obscuriglobus UQM 2246]